MRPLDEHALLRRQRDDASAAVVRGGALCTGALLVLAGALVTGAPLAIAFGGVFAALVAAAGVTLLRTGMKTRADLAKRVLPPARLLDR